MRIAFHSPLKTPDSAVPSGDRRVARLLMAALTRAGHEVDLATRLRSRDGEGDVTRQARLAELGTRLAARYLRLVSQGRRPRPDLWFTYHLYYKAPDLIGPLVAESLGIPYVVAEASVAHKRAGGPWDQGHRATLAALARADLAVGLNPHDRALVQPCLSPGARYLDLPPFLAIDGPPPARADGIDRPVALLAVGMMRAGDKLASYRVLGTALAQVPGDWRLTVVGDGPARTEVEAALASVADRVTWRGALDAPELDAAYGAADLLVWPAVNEAYGMALLEAQAAGLPVVAGDTGGVSAIVRHGTTGLLAPVGDADAFAGAVRTLVADPARRRSQGAKAAEISRAEHGLPAAAAALDAALRTLVEARR
ncbi:MULTISPECIES: glycosyltransferase family 4 protein [Thalassobaculum]|uniref:Glycosyltransferase involved in cell wall bisynthesis n=1 Tax=Thalassobaculum litoreum DSM 18839 TaxID=1123362 RepID=A0A8G2BJV4_9PROT|nr:MULTISPECIES: glycosyltransferase family 4 protein [Thalassobaculum]SDG11000.1 Glycosyltransferase involved in cell wall bisynthesis [Thalassobaculum litoreum DSM 18839]